MSAPPPLSFADLERAFEMIAQAVDAAGAAQERLFLAKLTLALAHRLGDLEALEAAIDEAARDLED